MHCSGCQCLGNDGLATMLNPKYLDQIPSDRKLLDRAVSQLDHPPDARAALVSGGCAVLHLPMVPHVISTELEGKALAKAALNSTQTPISHLLSMSKCSPSWISSNVT